MKKTTSLLLLSLSSLFLLASCSGISPHSEQDEREVVPINCIAVTPVVARTSDGLPPEQVKSLTSGAVYTTEILTNLLHNAPKARVLDEDDNFSLKSGVTQGRLGVVNTIGEQVGCQAVLLTSLERFRQRQGSNMAVEQPASAAFEMTLLQVPSGTVLWTADYQETQEPFLANIFSGKMGSRGFRWVTVEELVAQGMKERLNSCPYLK